jgi:hypothetical protein
MKIFLFLIKIFKKSTEIELELKKLKKYLFIIH